MYCSKTKCLGKFFVCHTHIQHTNTHTQCIELDGLNENMNDILYKQWSFLRTFNIRSKHRMPDRHFVKVLSFEKWNNFNSVNVNLFLATWVHRIVKRKPILEDDKMAREREFQLSTKMAPTRRCRVGLNTWWRQFFPPKFCPPSCFFSSLNCAAGLC